ncbi:TPA: fimbrial biogenesis outer membrane usher protein [Klebsiella quasipneumoniae subsp. similipneumoniae]|nr:fimbrial biogenesis outer membrane usher protein [Klebsiella quasipneumoniae subsp. similipneumoniae]
MRKYIPHISILLSSITAQVYAKDYFDPSLLATDVEDLEEVDLSIFSRPGGGMEGEQVVNIYVNEVFYCQRTLHFRNGPSGSLEPNFPVSFFDEMLNQNYRPNVNQEFLSTQELKETVPFSEVKFDQADSNLYISFPQAYLAHGAQMKTMPNTWDHGTSAFLMEYRLSGSQNNNDKAKHNNLFISSNYGFNFNGWRLRSSGNYTSYSASYRNNAKVTNNRFDFYNTYLERDIGKFRSTLALGELSTRGIIHDSFSYTGGSIYSNDEMLNDRLRNYTPTVRGIANSQAIVTISQNERIVLQVNVPPGPFEISDFTLSGYSGDLYVHVKESDGQEHSFIQPFSTLPEMKREGVTSFSFSAGRFGNGNSNENYADTTFIHGTWAQGFRDGVTLYGETIQANKYHLFGLGSTISLGEVGAVSGDVSLSIAEKDNDKYVGQSYGVKYSKSRVDTGTTLTLATYRYSTKDFYTFNNFSYKNKTDEYIVSNQLKNRISLNLNQSLSNFGYISLTASQQDYWTAEKGSKTFSLSHGFNFYGAHISNTFSLDQVFGEGQQKANNKSWGLYANIPFNVLLGRDEGSRASINYNMTKSKKQTRHSTAITGSIPDTRAQFRLSSGWGSSNHTNDSSISMSWNGDYITASTGYTRSGNSNVIDYNLNGSSIFYPWGAAFSSTSVINGAAIVETDGISGIKVRQGGETSAFGTAIVSSMQPYTENKVEIEHQGLPNDIVIGNSSKRFIPEKGSVVLLKYDIFKGKQVVFKLKRENGSNLPFGTVVSLVGRDIENTGIIDDDGRVYFAGIPNKGKLKASLGKNKSCEVDFDMEKVKENEDSMIYEYIGTCRS